jgi:hypothetical protein
MTPTTNIVDLELSDDELDHVCGGFTSSEHGAIEHVAAPAPGGGSVRYIEIGFPPVYWVADDAVRIVR